LEIRKKISIFFLSKSVSYKKFSVFPSANGRSPTSMGKKAVVPHNPERLEVYMDQNRSLNKKQTTEATNETLSHNQAAEYIGVASQTLYNWRNQRKGPDYIKLGRKIGYLKPDLDKYLEDHRVKLNG